MPLSRAIRIVHTAAVVAAALIGAGAVAQPSGKRSDVASGDAAVLAARDAFIAGDRNRLAIAAAGIGDHPLRSYGEFWSLLLRLRTERSGDLVALDAALAGFFARHPGTYVADRVRLDWLLALGSRRQFDVLLRERPPLVWGDDAQLLCYEMLARYVGRERAKAIAAEAAALLAATRESATEGCAMLADELIAHCRSLLAHFKCPREVRFGVVPKTSTGKIQKFRLRDLAKDA